MSTPRCTILPLDTATARGYLGAMNAISRIRQHTGWSQARLAAALGVSRQAVTWWEAGGRRPEIDIAWRMVQAARQEGLSLGLEDVYPEPRE